VRVCVCVYVEKGGGRGRERVNPHGCCVSGTERGAGVRRCVYILIYGFIYVFIYLDAF